MCRYQSQSDSVSSPGANICEQHGIRISPPGIPEPKIVQSLVFRSTSFSLASVTTPKHLSLTISAPAAPIPVPTQVMKQSNAALTSGEGCKAEWLEIQIEVRHGGTTPWLCYVQP